MRPPHRPGQSGFVRITVGGVDYDFATGEAHVFTIPG
jgi:hypothetical protein